MAGMGSTAERALFEAAKHGDAPAIRKLLSNSDRPDVNAKASSGCTALHYGKHAFCTMSFIVFARECLSDCKRGRDWEGGRQGGREKGREDERENKGRLGAHIHANSIQQATVHAHDCAIMRSSVDLHPKDEMRQRLGSTASWYEPAQVAGDEVQSRLGEQYVCIVVSIRDRGLVLFLTSEGPVSV